MTKVVVAWLAIVALALVAAGSCSIKHSSEQFECDTNADCVDLDGNRVCSDGLCVVPGGGPMKDAAVDGMRTDTLPDASLICPDQCTSCNIEKKECTVDCAGDPDTTTCMGQVKCPAGWSCNVKCNTASSCRAGVDCLGSTSCKIECSGFGSCRSVACGPGPCDITCSGSQSCGGTAGGVACGTSCACDVKCAAGANCFNVTCTKPQCDTGLGCSSQPTGCDTCP